MRLIFLIAVASLLSACSSRAAKPLAPGEVAFVADFEGAEPLHGWTGVSTLDDGYQSGHSLFVERQPDSGSGSAFADAKIPTERLRGGMIRISGMVRAEGVSERPQPWNGVKLMLRISRPGGTLYPQAKIETGTFGWTLVGCIVRVPSDAESADLLLGLEAVTGRAWFDDVKIAMIRPSAPLASTRPKAFRRVPAHPRFRGTMISPDISPESLRTLGGEWKANLIRWQLIRSASAASSQPDYDRWLDGELAKLDRALPYCRKYGLKVVLDLHSPPGGSAVSGGYMAADADLFSDRRCQDKFVEVWKRIARKYKGEKTIWAYDLANEPIEDTLAEGADDWPAMATRAARAIRAVEPKRTLVVEAAVGANPDGFDGMTPIDLPNVVYSVHMYQPHAFTHQGVFGPSAPVRYPGVIDGVSWDKSRLELALKPVIEFQKRYGVPIYAGEFSAIRWAPDDGAYRYLKDLIDVFEAHGWDWTYHAFREWDGWSVEHGPDPADHAPAAQPTSRETLLRSWFAKNEKTTP